MTQQEALRATEREKKKRIETKEVERKRTEKNTERVQEKTENTEEIMSFTGVITEVK